MVTHDERREAAEKLAGMAASTDVNWLKLMGALGVNSRDAAMLRLADLIEPTGREQVIADNLALIDRNRDLECELASLKARLGGISTIADRYNQRAQTILDGWRDRPIGGTDLGRIHAYEQMVGEIREALK